MVVYSLKTLCSDFIVKNGISYKKEELPEEVYNILETFPLYFNIQPRLEFMPLDLELEVYIKNNPFISGDGANLHRAIESGCFDLVKEIIERDGFSLDNKQYYHNFQKEYLSALDLLYKKVNKLNKKIHHYLEIQDFLMKFFQQNYMI